MNEATKPTNKAVKKQQNKEKLSVRDYITMAFLLILVFIVYMIIGIPLAMSGIGNILIHAACSLLWGSIFLLLYTRINKKWTVLVFGIILALIQIMNFWPTSAFLAIGAVISEIIWQKMDRKKFRTMTTVFTVQITFWYLGITIPMMIISNLGKYLAESYVEMYAEVKALLTGPVFLGALAATIICCIAGVFIGKALLKKHFAKAGIV